MSLKSIFLPKVSMVQYIDVLFPKHPNNMLNYVCHTVHHPLFKPFSSFKLRDIFDTKYYTEYCIITVLSLHTL